MGCDPRVKVLLQAPEPRPRLLPGESRIQLQVSDVSLDPGLTGIGADLPASFGLEDDARFGAVAAGLIIIVHKLARDLAGDIGEAAGRRSVGTN